MGLKVYKRDGIPNKKKGYTYAAQLFHLDISNCPSLDWFGEDRVDLDIAAKYGLAMCVHCKFYEKK